MIIVTGGCGFIGSKLVTKLLALGNKVTVIDNLRSSTTDNLPAGANFIHGDIRDSILVNSLMSEAKQCYHLAAITDVHYCEDNPEECISVNVDGSEIIFAAAAAHNVRVVYASSAAVYGELSTDECNKENGSPAPKSIYGQTKLDTELLAQRYKTENDLDAIGLRFFNVYGYPFSKSHYAGVIKLFFENIHKDLDLDIYGDGNQTRDFIAIHDIVNACVAIMNASDQQYTVLNVGTGEAISITNIATIITALYDRSNIKINYKPARSAEIYRSVADLARLNQVLPEYSTIALEQGLANIFEQLQETGTVNKSA